MPHRNLERKAHHDRFSPEKSYLAVSKKSQQKMRHDKQQSSMSNMKTVHYDDDKQDWEIAPVSAPNDAFQTVDVDIAAIGIRDDDLDFDDFKVAEPRHFNNTAKVGFTDELKTRSVQVFGQREGNFGEPEVKDVEDDRDFIRDIEQTENMKRSVYTASINLKNEADIGEGLQEPRPTDPRKRIQTEAKPDK